MGVDWYSCDKCGESYPDCGDHACCEAGHGLCGCCMPDDSYELTAENDGELPKAHCPVCSAGGTTEEIYRAALRDIAKYGGNNAATLVYIATEALERGKQ